MPLKFESEDAYHAWRSSTRGGRHAPAHHAPERKAAAHHAPVASIATTRRGSRKGNRKRQGPGVGMKLFRILKGFATETKRDVNRPHGRRRR